MRGYGARVGGHYTLPLAQYSFGKVGGNSTLFPVGVFQDFQKVQNQSVCLSVSPRFPGETLVFSFSVEIRTTNQTTIQLVTVVIITILHI